MSCEHFQPMPPQTLSPSCSSASSPRYPPAGGPRNRRPIGPRAATDSSTCRCVSSGRNRLLPAHGQCERDTYQRKAKKSTHPEVPAGANELAFSCMARRIRASLMLPRQARRRNSIDAESSHASSRTRLLRRFLLPNPNKIAIRVDDCELAHTPGFVLNAVQTRYTSAGKISSLTLSVQGVDVLHAPVPNLIAYRQRVLPGRHVGNRPRGVGGGL